MERDRIVYPFCWLKDIFSTEEFEKLYKFTRNLSPEESYIGGGEGEVNRAVRNSETKFFNPCSESFWLFEKINKTVESLNDTYYNFDLVGYDSIQYTRYSGHRTAFYNWHTDSMFGGAMEHHRKLSVVIMLSRPGVDFTGGEFQIAQGDLDDCQTIQLESGMMIVFPSYMLHRVTPVITGVRETLVTWVTGPKFR